MDERFWKGVRQFNERDFFTAHETLEDLWHEYRELDRPFLQAMIQLSAGFYHADAENFKGARSQLSKGLQKLVSYQPSHTKGVNVQSLVTDVEQCLSAVERIERGEISSFELSLFPQITILPDQSWKRQIYHGYDDN